MKLFREILIFSFVTLVFIYVVSVFTFTPYTNSILAYGSPSGTSLLGSFGAYVASLSFLLVGQASYFLALPFMGLILAFILQKKTWLHNIKWSIVLAIGLSGFYGLFAPATSQVQGGVIGNIASTLLTKLIGIIGATFSMLVLNGLILSKLFPSFSDKVKKTLEESRKKSKLNQNFEQAQTSNPGEPIAIPAHVVEQVSQRVPESPREKTVPIHSHTEENIDSKAAINPEVAEEMDQELLHELEAMVKEALEGDIDLPFPIYDNETEHFEEEKNQNPSWKETSPLGFTPVEVQMGYNLGARLQMGHPKMRDFWGETEDGAEDAQTEMVKENPLSDLVTKEAEIVSKAKSTEKPKSETAGVVIETHEKKESPSGLRQNAVKFFTGDFKFPSLNLLTAGEIQSPADKEKIQQTGQTLLNVLKDFNIEAELSNITTGPVVTRYELVPPKGLKINKIVTLMDNIAMSIASHDRIRIEAPIPGKSAVGIEVPNEERQIIRFKDLLTLQQFNPKKMAIPFALGKGISGKPYFTDIAKIPHLLIAGSTGSGKSVCVNTLICSILYSKTPDEVRLLLIDPKRVELKMYEDLPHLIAPVIKEPAEAILALNWAVAHMEERYKTIESYNVRNIEGYNTLREQEGKSTLPYLVIIMDEFADFMMLGGKEMEGPIIRLAAMARAVGIHIVLATQRPSSDVITGLIKANFPGRIAFKVSGKIESRIILDINGAESLLGKGDMLYASPNLPNIIRIQSPFITDEEVFKITEFYRSHYKSNYWDEILEGAPSEYNDEAHDPSEEPLFNEAVEIIIRENKASASYLQRRLKIGYNRAARIVEIMEDMGIVGPAVGSKPREVLVDSWS